MGKKSDNDSRIIIKEPISGSFFIIIRNAVTSRSDPQESNFRFTYTNISINTFRRLTFFIEAAHSDRIFLVRCILYGIVNRITF